MPDTITEKERAAIDAFLVDWVPPAKPKPAKLRQVSHLCNAFKVEGPAARAIRRPAATLASTGRRDVDIWSLLVWAFRDECASVDFNEVASVSGASPVGFGMEYILIERQRLGCAVDGGGRSDPHPDADLVASAVSALPEGCGGKQMALAIAELARADRWPDWGQELVPVCEPAEWRRSRHGRFAARTFWHGDGRVGRWPDRQLGRDDGYVCMVRYSGTAGEVAALRRNWTLWRLALLELRSTFQVRSDLSAFTVIDTLPPRAPWKIGA